MSGGRGEGVVWALSLFTNFKIDTPSPSLPLSVYVSLSQSLSPTSLCLSLYPITSYKDSYLALVLKLIGMWKCDHSTS